MGMLRIVSNRGDERRLWNEQDALAGDAEALRRFEKQNGSLHERAPGARRLFVSKRASWSSDLSSSTPRPRRLSWSPAWSGDERGNAGIHLGRDNRDYFPRAAWAVHR